MQLQKRGISEAVLWTIVSLMLVLMIGGGVLLFLSNLTTDTTFEKAFLARDTALLLNTITAVPGNVVHTYTQEEDGLMSYILQFEDRRVEVSNADSVDPSPLSFPFFESKTYFYEFEDLQRDPALHTTKDAGRVKVSDQPEPIFATGFLECEPILSEFSFLYIETGFESGVEEQVTQDIATILASLNQNSKILTRDGPQNIEAMKKEITVPNSLVLSLRVGENENTNDNGIVAYVATNKESRALACKVLNQLHANIAGITHTLIVPVETPLLSHNEGLALQLVIGNKNKEPNKILDDYQRVGSIIARGIVS